MTKYKKGPEFSEERETRVLLEHLDSQFRVFGEGMADMRKDMTNMREDITEMRKDLTEVCGRVERIEGKVGHLESEMAFVRKVLPTVATKDDLKQTEKRLTALETAR